MPCVQRVINSKKHVYSELRSAIHGVKQLEFGQVGLQQDKSGKAGRALGLQLPREHGLESPL